MPEFMTEEAIREAIDNNDVSVMNKLLSNEIAVGEPSAEEVEDTTVQVEDVAGEVVDETVQEVQQEADVVVDNTEDVQREIEALKAKQEEELRLARAEAERIKAEADAARKEAESVAAEKLRIQEELEKKIREENKPKIEEDPEDIELAGTFSKNNRALIEDLKTNLTNAVGKDQYDELSNKLEKLLLADEERQKENEKRAAEDAANERKNKMFSEVNNFQEKFEHFKLDRDIKDFYTEHNQFRKRVSEYIHSNDESEINKAVRGIVTQDSDKFKAMRDSVQKAGIEVPEGAQTYLELSEIVDLKNGYKYNKYTGEYETITDDYGNQVCQKSLEDAFKLSTYYDRVSEARMEQATEIQRKLDGRENSAVTLPPEQLSNGTEQDDMTNEEMNSILDMPTSMINSNPELKKKLNMVYEKLGIN